MKALSIKQPWASLIAHGIKDVENRTWRTKFRGRIYIHASMSPAFIGSYKGKIPLWDNLSWDKKTDLITSFQDRSAIVGEVDIVDCVKNHPSIWSQDDCWNWVLANAELYKEPILGVKGKLSFWDFKR